jgi:large conductance mechanosensitive channel
VLEGFKKFILRGNVVDLAIGVVIGVAFQAVVDSFTNDVLMRFIGAIVGKPSFNDLVLHVGDGEVFYGRFITAVVNFLIIAAAIYFLVVVPLNALAERRKRRQGEPEELTNEERMIELLERIAAK